MIAAYNQKITPCASVPLAAFAPLPSGQVNGSFSCTPGQPFKIKHIARTSLTSLLSLSTFSHYTVSQSERP